MLLFCPECSGKLDQSGRVNGVRCFDCKKSYILKFEFIEIDDIGESESQGTPKEGSGGEEVKNLSSDGPVRSGQV